MFRGKRYVIKHLSEGRKKSSAVQQPPKGRKSNFERRGLTTNGRKFCLKGEKRRKKSTLQNRQNLIRKSRGSMV